MQINEQRLKRKALTNNVKALLDQYPVGSNRNGGASNFIKTLVNSQEILHAFLGFYKALAASKLSKATLLKIGLAISELHNSEYDVAALSFEAAKSGTSPNEIELNRRASSEVASDKAILEFAQKVVLKKGILKDEELYLFLQYSKDETLIIEILAVIAVTTFANLINNLANTELDFPRIKEIPHTRI